MLTEAEIKVAVERVLRSRFGDRVQAVVARSGLDELGTPAIFVEAVLAPGTDRLGGAATIAAGHDVGTYLLEHGDERFPFLSFVYPDEIDDEASARGLLS